MLVSTLLFIQACVPPSVECPHRENIFIFNSEVSGHNDVSQIQNDILVEDNIGNLYSGFKVQTLSLPGPNSEKNTEDEIRLNLVCSDTINCAGIYSITIVFHDEFTLQKPLNLIKTISTGDLRPGTASVYFYRANADGLSHLTGSITVNDLTYTKTGNVNSLGYTEYHVSLSLSVIASEEGALPLKLSGDLTIEGTEYLEPILCH